MKLFKLLQFRKRYKDNQMLKQFGQAYFLELKENSKFMNYVNNSNPRLKRRTENIFKRFK